MRHIQATLPTLGTVDVHFYAESAEVLDFFGGENEIGRMDQVDHLGTASRAFTGVNHTRLEYMLLQSALIQLVASLHKDHDDLALSGRVKLDGPRNRISSGEELLKCWSILSNAGHPKWTYGVERGMLQAARSNDQIRRWLVDVTRLSDLKSWINDQIDRYNDGKMHFLITLRRIAYGEPYDRRKTKFAHLLRNLLLPIESLLADDAEARQKLSRLRKLYARVRLLSIVTLDSYYSHNPFRIALSSTVHSFRQLASLTRRSVQFDRILQTMAAWLADELYIHPDASGIQREYQARAKRRFPQVFANAWGSPKKLKHMLANIMHTGHGDPRIGRLRPLVRLSFDPPRRHLLGKGDLYTSARELRDRLCRMPSTDLALEQNPFSNRIHLDLFYRRDDATISDVAYTFKKVAFWLLRTIEAETLAELRSLKRFFKGTDGDRRFAELKADRLADRLYDESDLMEGFFFGVLKYILPERWNVQIMPRLPSESVDWNILWRITSPSGQQIDNATPFLKHQLEENPSQLPDDTLHEFKGIRRILRYTTGHIVLACPDSVKITDEYDTDKDEWDGTVVEVREDGIRVQVFEGKNLSKGREAAALEQLEDTATFVTDRVSRYRRRRCTGLGAKLVAYLDTAG